MERLHLIRHAEVENPHHLVYGELPGFGLSELGRHQAEQLAEHLAECEIVAVWSSPLQRAWETAQVMAMSHRMPVKVADDLTEWRLSRRWVGLVWDDIETQRPGELAAYLANPESLPFLSETLEECAGRMTELIEALHVRYRRGDVAIVSHQDPVQAVRLTLTGRPLSDLHNEKPTHGSVWTLTPGVPWYEVGRWQPPAQGLSFPPNRVAR